MFRYVIAQTHQYKHQLQQKNFEHVLDSVKVKVKIFHLEMRNIH